MSYQQQSPLKLAFVKQDVDRVLYLNSSSAALEEIIFSSLMKTGPAGFLDASNADFIILKEEADLECQFWKHDKSSLMAFHHIQECRKLKDHPSKTFLKNCYSEFDVCADDFSVSYKDIDWASYDIVVCLDIPVPSKVVRNTPGTLWCYYVSEPVHRLFNHVWFGYDCYLNQECFDPRYLKNGVIPCPFTFLKPDTLERVMVSHLKRKSRQSGIYAEINCVKERPVRHVPQLDYLSDLHPIRLHRPVIRENLIDLFDSKYFVKLGGRQIRGNSIVEAISCGTLVLLDPDDLFSHRELIPDSCCVRSAEELRAKIEAFDFDPQAYEAALCEQRELVWTYVYHKPLEAIYQAYEEKKKRKAFKSIFRTVWIIKLQTAIFIMTHYLLLVIREVRLKFKFTSYRR